MKNIAIYSFLLFSTYSHAILQIIPKPDNVYIRTNGSDRTIAYCIKAQACADIVDPYEASLIADYGPADNRSFDGYSIYGFWTYWIRLGSVYSAKASFCPTSHPIDNGDGTCSGEAPPPPIPSCEDEETQKSIQVDRYTCQTGNQDPAHFDTNFNYSCTNTDEGFDYSSTCDYSSNGCFVDCDKETDQPICNPATENCELPPPTQPPTGGGDGSGGSGGGDSDLCSTHPELCAGPGTEDPDNGCEAPADAPWLCDNPDERPENPTPENPEPDNSGSAINAQNDTTKAIRDLNKTEYQSLEQLKGINQKLSDIDQGIQSNNNYNTALLSSSDKQMEELKRISELNEMANEGYAMLNDEFVYVGEGIDSLNSGIGTLNQGIGDIVNTLKEPFCVHNPQHPDCIAKSPFGDVPTIDEKSPFEDIIGDTATEKLVKEGDDIKKQIEDLYEKFKSDVIQKPSFVENGSINSHSLSIRQAGHNVSVRSTYWQDNTGFVYHAVLLLSTLIAFGIVMTRKS